MSQQLEFDFPRGRKLWILDCLARNRLLSKRMIATLRAIDSVARNDQTVVMSYEEIADYLSQSRATAKRGVKELEEESLLIVNRHYSWQGQIKNSYQIVWSNLRELVDDNEPPPVDVSPEKFRGVKNSCTPVQNEPPPGSKSVDPRFKMTPLTDLPVQRSITPPPPIPIEDLWKEVEEELIRNGVGAWEGPVQHAQAKGIAPHHCLKLIKYFSQEPGRWGAGALHRRIMAAHPELPVDQGWPADSPEWIQEQKEKSAAKSRARAQETKQLEQAKRKQAERESQQLEQEFGPLLDSMTHSEIEALVTGLGTFYLGRFRKGEIKELRQVLLERLSQTGSRELILSNLSQAPEDPGPGPRSFIHDSSISNQSDH